MYYHFFFQSYVDSSRMISVQMSGADDDLKSMMRSQGIAGNRKKPLKPLKPKRKVFSTKVFIKVAP